MADEQYEIDISEPAAVMEGLQDDLRSDDLTLFAACHNGDLQRQLDRAGARLQVSSLRADSDTAEGSFASRLQTVADETAAFETESALYKDACQGRLEDLGVISRTVAELYLQALDEVALAQADLATSRDAAWAAFEICDTSNASPFVFSVVDITSTVPWDADKGIASLFPPMCLPESRIPDTGVTQCWADAYEPLLSCPAAGEAFYGQDAHYLLAPMNFETDLGNTIVNDLVTGLTWEWRDPDTFPEFYGDHASATTYCASLQLGG